ncbi:hypothetical protein [Cellulomonas oligotrophica]|uniref:Uncharacterized protein n=1 Tax=Cellulomonas oligotrophica TaxID=931536 RepID=A0A7Y9FGI5_9CELL|nr:hypothetical protein [Cellulomonas oligotrophica]NYD85576.1 hypothetical protein [Cellulomonas oligotrophica]GIG31415.1 hypothetical protein Col01nite_05740 [Cellulomonas oligotrophica]
MTTHHAPALVPSATDAPAQPQHDVRSAVAVVAAGLVLVALLVGGTALLTAVLDVARWVSA